MPVRDLMTPGPDLVTVEADESVAQAVALIMRREIGALPVMDGGGKPVGIVAERDVVSALHENPDRVLGLRVEDVMRGPPPTCQADDEISTVMARMTRERARHLLVLDGRELAGVVSVGDLLSHRVRQLEMEAGVLRDVVAAQRGRT